MNYSFPDRNVSVRVANKSFSAMEKKENVSMDVTRDTITHCLQCSRTQEQYCAKRWFTYVLLILYNSCGVVTLLSCATNFRAQDWDRLKFQRELKYSCTVFPPLSSCVSVTLCRSLFLIFPPLPSLHRRGVNKSLQSNMSLSCFTAALCMTTW